MTEIKLTKRYPQSRTEDIVDAYMRGWNDALDAVQNGKFIINDDRKTEPIDKDINVRSKTEPQTDCETCRHWKYIAKEWQCEAIKCQGYEPQTEMEKSGSRAVQTARCLNCHNAKACKENHWEGCKYEPWKLTAVDDEPQTDCAWQNDEFIPTDLASTMLKERFKEQK